MSIQRQNNQEGFSGESGKFIRKLHAKRVTTSESGGEYFQVLFEKEWESEPVKDETDMIEGLNP